MHKAGITITVDCPTDCLIPEETGTEPDVQLLPTPSNAELNAKFEAGLSESAQSDPVHAVHSLDALRSGTLHGIDHAHKERHLHRDDFVAVFGIKPEEFELLPNEEQAKLKKDVGLSYYEVDTA